MTCLIIGATGLIGKAVMRSVASSGAQVLGTHFSRPHPDAEIRLDVCDADDTSRLMERVRPSAVVLAARAPEPSEHDVWPAAVNSLAASSSAVGARVVLFSSNRVFCRGAPRTEADEPDAVDARGRLEIAVEQAVRKASPASLVIRTADVFGWSRGSVNLATRVWHRLQAGEGLVLRDDEPITPTFADYLAEVCARLLESREAGVVHVTNGEQTTAFQLARRLALAFGLDAALIERADAAVDGEPIARPGLRLGRLLELLATPPPRLDAAVQGVRRAWLADGRSTHAPVGSGVAESAHAEILRQVADYQSRVESERRRFVPFESRVHYAGRVYGAAEVVNLVDSALSFWLTMGPYGDRFEAELRGLFGARDAVMTSSGSTANLNALLSLTSRQLDRPIRPGDEIITPAVTFPTTLAPIVHLGAVPVFIDCEVGTYNIDPALLEGAVSERTRAIVVPHTLGNPCDMDVVVKVAREHDLFLLEDSCDALGSRFRGRLVGTFGELATISFYPAHHITTGEGGCVIVNSARLSRIVRSIRDWGRDCWCPTGEDNRCAKRFGWQSGDLPAGYDHKFTFSNIGYNFKPTDMQAAIGVAQLQRLPSFVEARKRNFGRLYGALRAYERELVLPTLDSRSDPSWFGFPITVRPGTSRRALVQWLEESNIETRMILAGNILRHPAYCDIAHRVFGTLERTDEIMAQSFFIGVYPGLTDAAVDFVIDRFRAFFDS